MGGILTAIGEAKMAGSIGGTAVNLTTVRIGDGNNAVVTPVRTMTDLVRRVGSALPITASARDPDNASMWRITTEIPAGSGPFNLREIAVFDSAGDMIAIASHPLVEFLGPGGDAVSIITDIVFPVSASANVNISITPSVMTPLARHPRGFFMAVDGVLNAPPATPAIGATYVIGAAPTGAWVGRAGDIAQWTGLDWSLITVPVGHLVVDNSAAVSSASRYLRRAEASWISAAADDAAYGVARRATEAEADAGTGDGFLTPERLNSSLFITGPETYTIGTGGDFATPHAAIEWLSRKIITQTGSVTLVDLGGVSTFSDDLIIDLPHASRISIAGAAMAGAVPDGAAFAVTGYGSGERATDSAAHKALIEAAFNSEWRFSGAARLLVRHTNLGGLSNIALVGVSGHAASLLELQRGSIHNMNGQVALVGAGGTAASLDDGSMLRGSGGLIVTGAANHGLSASRSLVALGTIITRSSAGNGIQADRGPVSAGDIDSSGHGARAILSQHGGADVLALTITTNHSATGGAVADNGGRIRWETKVYARWNGGPGLEAGPDSRISGPGLNSEVRDNVTYNSLARGGRIDIAGGVNYGGSVTSDIRAEHGGYADVTGALGTISTSPAPNTVGNDNAYIRKA